MPLAKKATKRILPAATKHTAPALRMGSSASTRTAPAARPPPPPRPAPPSLGLGGYSSVDSSPGYASHPVYPGYQTPHAAALAGGPYLANVAYPLQYDYTQQQYQQLPPHAHLQQPWNHLSAPGNPYDHGSSSGGDSDSAAAAGQSPCRRTATFRPPAAALVLAAEAAVCGT